MEKRVVGRTTISIYDETKKRFIQARGSLEKSNGKRRNEDSVLNHLLNLFEQFPAKAHLENIQSILQDVSTEYPGVIRYESALSTIKQLVEMAKCFG